MPSFPRFTLPPEPAELREQVRQLGEGPSEVHRMVIVRSLFR